MKNTNRMAAVAMAAMVTAALTLGSYSPAHAQLVPRKRSVYFADASSTDGNGFVIRKRSQYIADASQTDATGIVIKKRSQYIADAEQFQIKLRTVWFARLSYLLRRPQ